MRKSWIAAGLALLLTGSYFDSVRGPLLPVLAESLGIGYAAASWFLAAGSFAAIACTYALLPLSRRLPPRPLALGVCGLGVACGPLAFLVNDYAALIVLAVCLGAAVSTMGAMSNVFVIGGTDEKSRARFLCGLHMMYALGSLVAPLIASRLLERGFSWRTVILAGAPPILLLAGYITSRVEKEEPREARASIESEAISPALRVAILACFAAYVGGEVMLSAWMPTYLMEHAKLGLSESASFVVGFFVVMAVTRGLCFASLSPRRETVALVSSLVGGIVFFALGRAGWLIGFALAGVVGPFFPLLLARTSRRFERESRTMALQVLVVMQITFASLHFLVGQITDRYGIDRAYWIPEAGLLCALLGFWTVEKVSLNFRVSRTLRAVYLVGRLQWARVAELVDARDLKSLGPLGRAGSIPAASSYLIQTNFGVFRHFAPEKPASLSSPPPLGL